MMTIQKPKQTILRWQICKHCECNIPGKLFDLQVHLVEDHNLDAWCMTEQDIKDEYKFKIDIRNYNLKPISCLD